MTLGPKLHIDQAALQHNIKVIKELAPHQSILAMVKANGYGHGLWNVVSAVHDHVNALGVARLQDALMLRTRGVTQRIVVMNGFANAAELKACSEQQIEVVIHIPEQLTILQECTTLPQPIRVWFKINTGMNRLGFSVNEAPAVYQFLQNHPGIQKPIVAMTHFACADDFDNDMTYDQVETFYDLTNDWEVERSLANSAGVMGWTESLADWIRPGIMMYGASPLPHSSGSNFDLKAVMTLSSTIIAIHDRAKGDKIGYGSVYECPAAMRVAIVAIGYGDGYPRSAPSGTPVWINNKICKLVGRVSMDLIAVDLSNCPDAKINDKVVLWGPQLAVETVADYAGTIGYELLCGMGYFYR
jgi:alanine racemase